LIKNRPTCIEKKEGRIIVITIIDREKCIIPFFFTIKQYPKKKRKAIMRISSTPNESEKSSFSGFSSLKLFICPIS
jgi:hypothetical protein